MSDQPARTRPAPREGGASRPAASRRLLLVHAHPDDESINNGVTMAKYAAEGARVTLVTCTRGEEGEVIPPDLAHLAPDRDDTLGEYRVGELAAAMAALGVTDHRFLGGPGRYRDSGMMGAPQNERPDAFWQAPLDEAAGHLVAVIREVRPQVLVTYDPDGGYGHPDHIQAHRVAMRGAELAARADFRPELGGAHTIGKIYWNCNPRSEVEEGFARLRAAGHGFPGIAAVDDVPGVVPDSEVTASLTGEPAHTAAKTAAMRAHHTQIAVDGPFFALSNDLGQPLFGTEHYRLVHGSPGAADGAREDDLFAGWDDMAGMRESARFEEAAE
ncbi:N-acetyl-1-D-myo-inositol-2-amino-2-deoxy-alpha-D-glucopyranoside deacetylase [Streptomyces angustmyceticus]|uniref:1D-myo-inositol 2-acetamido-2-deoxy-alpha-D-glucopyranoside deacetylase n=1 Tax=Streptomyces angustmyceticus TaxID=285578 RepID=A0A5J4LFX5_9ACTN|nr:N-acetyl-1-D-myo-inositol-2-amino-2-deoxy-alpha-D-glucopyranoside deacetylase [Streptomyces angustmyceticus]UAL67284.1 N-acetyl-1-D-myo-inositol-2-amino-2-deoxy-alpha-D-glucopyranoside deacetylase [Streptomyces angustmyceticus]GES30400.1 1D-myo-inositol 2-acetamido-2-deoxy-alpha-D-glucopyranoside deacetylase [Streptomyces angustmyceticus]